jgi:hypothetical protein
MPDTAQTKLAKAKLQPLDANLKPITNSANEVTVQFNPETLKVSFANQLETPSGAGGDQRGPQARQFVGAGTTKLAVQVWFDVTSVGEGETQVDDVRRLTQKVAFFITPKPEKKGKDTKFIPPAVRFLWGTFHFDGIMESMEESLEFFSEDGRPLRGSVSFTLSQQKIEQVKFGEPVKQPPGAGGTEPEGTGSGPPGTNTMTQAPANSSVQGLAAAAGLGGDWQSIAAANGIENPRRLAAGTLLDLNVGVSAGVSLGVSADVSAGVSAGVSIGGGISLGAGAGGGVGLDAAIGGGASLSGGLGLQGSASTGLSGGFSADASFGFEG